MEQENKTVVSEVAPEEFVKKTIHEEVDQDELSNYSFIIQKLFALILKSVSKEEKEEERGRKTENLGNLRSDFQ